MYEWQQLIQTVVNEMDDAIMRRDDQALTLRELAHVCTILSTTPPINSARSQVCPCVPTCTSGAWPLP